MWLYCSECGSNLPSARAHCPVCGRPPPPEEPRRRRSRVWPALLVLALLGAATAGILLLNPPLLTSLADRTELPLG